MLKSSTASLKILVNLIEPNPLLKKTIHKQLLETSRIQITDSTRVNSRMQLSGSNLVNVIDRGTLGSRFVQILQQVIVAMPESRVVVLDYADLPTSEICSLIRFGVHGYIPYTRLDKDLADAIKKLSEDELWFPPVALYQYVKSTNRNQQKKKHSGLELTFREEQIMSLLKKGFSNKEMSSALNIS
jgi:DNA-binding NarL/FixJ family response regulator